MPSLEVKVTDFITGITRVVETQECIVAAATKSNLRRQTQTEGTAFCLPPLEDTFGPCANNEANCYAVIVAIFISPKGWILLLFPYYKRWNNQHLSVIRG